MGQALQKPEFGPSDVRNKEILMSAKVIIFSVQFQEAALLLHVYDKVFKLLQLWSVLLGFFFKR